VLGDGGYSEEWLETDKEWLHYIIPTALNGCYNYHHNGQKKGLYRQGKLIREVMIHNEFCDYSVNGERKGWLEHKVGDCVPDNWANK
jgi:hypothetical protein